MPIPLLLALSLATAPSPNQTHFAMRVDATLVGRASLKVEGGRFDYRSETLVRRGPSVTLNSSRASGTLGEGAALRSLEAQRREGGVTVLSLTGRSQGGALALHALSFDGTARDSIAPVGAVPSALAPLLLDGVEPRCVPVVDELSGRSGEACGRREGGRVVGEVLGERFVARVEEGRLEWLELPELRTRFERTDGEVALVAPPDLFGEGVAVPGLSGLEEGEQVVFEAALDRLPETANQRVARRANRLQVRWRRRGPAADEPLGQPSQRKGQLDDVSRRLCPAGAGRWAAAEAIARFVDARVEDVPFESERSAERVFAARRGTCVGHTELFLALARRCGLPARRALGLAAGEGRLWGHAWAQVEVGGAWWDVDPSEGAAPPHAVRLLFSAGGGMDDPAAARLFANLRALKLEARMDEPPQP